MGQKWPNVRISANFFTKPGFYKDSKKLLGNIYVDYENTFGAYVGILSGFYLDYKKENQDSIGITKTTEKWLWDSIWIPKKRNEKLFEDSIFFSGFFGILRDSTGF